MKRLAIVAAVAAVAASTASAHPGHGPVTVLAANFAYDPANVVVGQGDSVVWYFSGAVDRNHSITSEPGQADQFDSDPGVASPPQKPRSSYYARVFRTIGKFRYLCKNHPGMRGTVEVRSVSGTVDDVPPTLSAVRLSRTRVCARRPPAAAPLAPRSPSGCPSPRTWWRASSACDGGDGAPRRSSTSRAGGAPTAARSVSAG